MILKIKGSKLSKFHEEILVLPRAGRIDTATNTEITEDLVFRFRPVVDWDDFNKYCPEPTPPNIQYPGKPQEPDYTDTDYKKAMGIFNTRQFLWYIIQSIRATPDLEFETIQADKPDTWKNFDAELRESGLTGTEIHLIYDTAARVNCLNDTAVAKARETFLSLQRAAEAT